MSFTSNCKKKRCHNLGYDLFGKFWQKDNSFVLFEWYNGSERGSKYMGSSRTATERRIKIIEFLVSKKETTRKELASAFGVSIETIRRDLIDITMFAPIFTKPGNNGGVYILPEYQFNRYYLTEEEEDCLNGLMVYANDVQQKLIYGILTKFNKNAVLAGR